jgi:hypothetical protein
MTTILIIFIYILVSGIVIKFIAPILLNIIGLPGSLIGLKSTEKNQFKYLFGSFICAIGHTYLYVSFVIYVIIISQKLIIKYSLNNYIIWFLTFIVLIGTIQQIYYNAKIEFKENKTNYLNPQINGLFITQFTSFFAFVFFLYDLKYICPIWCWVEKIPQLI